MSKPMLVTVPFVLLLLDFWPLDRMRTSTILWLAMEKLPFLALSLASSAGVNWATAFCACACNCCNSSLVW